MNDKIKDLETVPGVSLTFSNNPRPETSVVIGPVISPIVSCSPPFSVVRHLLSGKPLHGAGRLPRPRA